MSYRFVFETKYPETPKGKRATKRNIYGNMVGYVAGRRFWEFGDAYHSGNVRMAEAWVECGDLQKAWEDS